MVSALLLTCLLPSCAAARAPRLRDSPPRVPAVAANPDPALAGRAAIAGWPRPDVLRLALRAFSCGRAVGYFDTPLLTVIDYSLPSTERRLWVIDLAAKRILFHELVAHGLNSGEDTAVAFSNRPGSKQSSLGLFLTEDSYAGRHGASLRLSGLEPGVNDLAAERAIVMHGASYVSASYMAEHGQLGRSWGCPAVDLRVHRQIIDRIQGGTAVFAYYPDPTWLRTSRFLHCDAQVVRR